MAETREVYEAGNQKAESGVDPFSEKVTPAVEYVVARWGVLSNPDLLEHQQTLVIEGQITSMTAEATEGLKGLGGSEHDPTAARGYLQYGPDNLKCDFVVEKATEKIRTFGDIEIVREVYRQLARGLNLETHQVLVRHVDTLIDEPSQKFHENVRVLRGGKPAQAPRVNAQRKEVTTEQLPPELEAI
jgi:hypothetical protein